MLTIKASFTAISNRATFFLVIGVETSSDLTRTLTIFGTPGYIAPEQAAGPGARLTVAADIYNLGAILFELLAGRPPFLGENALTVLRQVTENPAPRLRSLAPHLDRDLETVCARCLEREPLARYDSAGAVARDLQNWLEGRPIVARPVGIPVRVWRWSRRNRLLASTLGAVLTLATASVPWGIHSWKLQAAARESTLAGRSVAVLPFLDLDYVRPDETLAQSIADSLQRELDRTSPARITMPLLASSDWATAEQIRNVGQTAKTRAILTGTERSVHGKKRISLRLLDAVTAEPLLVRVCEGSRQDPKKIVSSEVGRTIDAVLSTKDWSNLAQSKIDPGLRNRATREAIMAGHELVFGYTATDLDRAINLFKEAVRAEPKSLLAHAYLAMTATSRTHFISDDSFLKLGEAEAYEALRLSPNSKEAHRALAGVLYRGADGETARLIGVTLDTLGRPDRALGWHSLASDLSGASADACGLIGDCWTKLGDDEKALKAYSHAVEFYPEFPQASIGLCHLRLLQGNFEAARDLCRSSRWNHGGLGEGEQIEAQIEFFARRFDLAVKLYAALSVTDVNGGGSFYGAVSYQSALGRTKQTTGDRIGAQMVLKRCLQTETAAVKRTPANPEALYRLAAVESSLGMLQQSIHHLREAVRSGWIDYRSLAMDPRFDAVREDPRVKIILKDLAFKVADLRLKLLNNNYRNMEE